jgi:hypothetical protein
MAAHGQPVTFRELCSRIVQLDESTRATPDDTRREIYSQQIGRQTDLTRRMHAAGYL